MHVDNPLDILTSVYEQIGEKSIPIRYPRNGALSLASGHSSHGGFEQVEPLYGIRSGIVSDCHNASSVELI